MTARQCGMPTGFVGEMVVGDDEVEAEGAGFVAASAKARMPVSTEMTRRMPEAAALGEDAGLHAVALADAMGDVVGDVAGGGFDGGAMRSMVVLSRTVAVVPSTS